MRIERGERVEMDVTVIEVEIEIIMKIGIEVEIEIIIKTGIEVEIEIIIKIGIEVEIVPGMEGTGIALETGRGRDRNRMDSWLDMVQQWQLCNAVDRCLEVAEV